MTFQPSWISFQSSGLFLSGQRRAGAFFEGCHLNVRSHTCRIWKQASEHGEASKGGHKCTEIFSRYSWWKCFTNWCGACALGLFVGLLEHSGILRLLLQHEDGLFKRGFIQWVQARELLGFLSPEGWDSLPHFLSQPWREPSRLSETPAWLVPTSAANFQGLTHSL